MISVHHKKLYAKFSNSVEMDKEFIQVAENVYQVMTEQLGLSDDEAEIKMLSLIKEAIDRRRIRIARN